MAEDMILDFSKRSNMAVMILRFVALARCTSSLSNLAMIFHLVDMIRYFNVIGSDPEGRLGEAPKPELREHGRISGACFDAALGIIPELKV